MRNKKGILLIYVLFISVLISIFLLTAVGNMNNSFLTTNIFTGENKAYWAAESGIQYCEYKLKSDIGWPFLTNKEYTEKFGKFTITSKKDGENGYYVHGKTDKREEFCIYFSKKEKKIAELNNITTYNIIPDKFPSDPKSLSYCSYSSITKSDKENLLNGATNNNDNTEKELIVSKSPVEHKIMIISPGIYIVSDGRCGAYRSVIEKMLIADNSNGFNAGIYAGGNINITMSGHNSTFAVSNIANSKPEVYCKGQIKITRNGHSNSNSKYVFPISMENGTIYYGNRNSFNICDKIENGINESTTKITNNEFKRKYGLNLEEYSASKDDLFPKIQWEQVEKIRKNQESKEDKNGKPIIKYPKSGSYFAILEDSNEYILCNLSKNYIEEGEFSTKKFNDDLDNADASLEEKRKEIREKYSEPIRDKYGNIIDYVLTAEGHILIDKTLTDKALINQLIKNVNGLSDDADVDKYIIDSQKTNSIFSIETEKNEFFEDNDEEDDDNHHKDKVKAQKAQFIPKITLKKSIEMVPETISNEEYFNLIALTKNNEGKFDINQSVKTELIFQDQTNELPVKKGEDDSLIPDKTMTMLYTQGSVYINGQLSGNGQILSCGNIYFKAGTRLNTNLSGEEANNKIALYSKGSIIMGVPEGKGNLTDLYTKIRKALAGESAMYTTTIVNRALNSTVEQTDLTDKEKKRLSKSNKGDISLKNCMMKCYGYTSREAKNFIENIVQKNAYTLYNYYNSIYYMPKKEEDITIESQNPSSFSGVIYSWGGFKSNAEYKDVIINGVLVTYGANPDYQPGSGKGLNEANSADNDIKNGGIKIENCENFKVMYTSSDINTFMKLCKQEKPIGLTKIYQNVL